LISYNGSSLMRSLVEVSNAPPLLPSILSPVPRVAIAVEFGSFLGSLICSDSNGTRHFALEARTDGFIFTADSTFFAREYSVYRNDFDNTFPDRIPLQMNVGLSFVSEPTFLRVRSDYHSSSHRFSKFGTVESDSLGDSVLCLESVEVMGQATAVGDIKDDMESTVSLDTSSICLGSYIVQQTRYLSRSGIQTSSWP
jgi:hypothetical protein